MNPEFPVPPRTIAFFYKYSEDSGALSGVVLSCMDCPFESYDYVTAENHQKKHPRSWQRFRRKKVSLERPRTTPDWDKIEQEKALRYRAERLAAARKDLEKL